MELSRLQQENEELRAARDVAEKNYHLLMNENNALNIKLENLGIYFFTYWRAKLTLIEIQRTFLLAILFRKARIHSKAIARRWAMNS